jgi:glutamyl-tRNA synthetase
VEVPADIGDWLQRLGAGQLDLDEAERRVLAAAGGAFFDAALTALDTSPGEFREFARCVGTATGLKGKDLFMPLRVALTGARHGPEMGRVWDWLGPQVCRARLRAALDYCRGVESDAETV